MFTKAGKAFVIRRAPPSSAAILSQQPKGVVGIEKNGTIFPVVAGIRHRHPAGRQRLHHQPLIEWTGVMAVAFSLLRFCHVGFSLPQARGYFGFGSARPRPGLPSLPARANLTALQSACAAFATS